MNSTLPATPANSSVVHVLTHSDYSCRHFGVVPMPDIYFLGQLVLSSFLQDYLFGSGDLKVAQHVRLSWLVLLFATSQIAMFTVVCARALMQLNDGSISGTRWHQYQIVMYTILEKGTFTGTLMLACKSYVETNLHES